VGKGFFFPLKIVNFIVQYMQFKVMTTSVNDINKCCMTPLSIGFEIVESEKFHKWLKVKCGKLHEQIKEDGRYGYRFFSGSSFVYAVKFHHNDTYDVYRLNKSKNNKGK